MNIKKEDFQVYDKHLGNDGGSYKKLGKGTWYNDEMYQEALKQGQSLPIHSVICCAKCKQELCLEMIEEQKDEIEMECDVLCKKHWEDDRLYMADLVMY